MSGGRGRLVWMLDAVALLSVLSLLAVFWVGSP